MNTITLLSVNYRKGKNTTLYMYHTIMSFSVKYGFATREYHNVILNVKHRLKIYDLITGIANHLVIALYIPW